MEQIKITNPTDSKSFTFYDNASGVILREFSGFEYPDVRPVIEDISGPQSAAYVTSKFGRRRLSFQGDLVSASVYTLRRSLLAALRQTGELKLLEFTTYDNLALRCEVEVVKVVFPYTHQIHSFLIEMEAPDWRFYSQSEASSESANESQTVTNNGNEATDPNFRINGPITDVRLDNFSSGLYFVIDHVLTVGQYIDVDVKNRTVKDHTGASVFADFEGDFFDILSGANNLNFTPTGGTGATTLETVFRHAYNGL